MAPRNITPGTVVIILCGPNAGKRAVYIKPATTGYLTVAGPSCPVTRVPRRHCVATSTKVDVSSVKDEIEGELNTIIKKDLLLEEYLNTPFSLNECLGVAPHELTF
ncbi:60S ribosomal protein L6 [Gregarina niphandrodes]|uniref:60S ribosomal protein L6 n=1 Tax=Gregarina niphandrodes TaxID=110365 RepID=A0A023B6W9_GRENI|nr:60S ribosomal protein L6 [Gregarina niphandrodes]EZG66800.1 60S ribosomal protein L6 [Gregarina niphandrodes]|eukprot:XP_011130482.1 60S ribosomal protein L6 [Gregarina niphandrodes]